MARGAGAAALADVGLPVRRLQRGPVPGLRHPGLAGGAPGAVAPGRCSRRGRLLHADHRALPGPRADRRVPHRAAARTAGGVAGAAVRAVGALLRLSPRPQRRLAGLEARAGGRLGAAPGVAVGVTDHHVAVGHGRRAVRLGVPAGDRRGRRRDRARAGPAPPATVERVRLRGSPGGRPGLLRLLSVDPALGPALVAALSARRPREHPGPPLETVCSSPTPWWRAR